MTPARAHLSAVTLVGLLWLTACKPNSPDELSLERQLVSVLALDDGSVAALWSLEDDGAFLAAYDRDGRRVWTQQRAGRVAREAMVAIPSIHAIGIGMVLQDSGRRIFRLESLESSDGSLISNTELPTASGASEDSSRPRMTGIVVASEASTRLIADLGSYGSTVLRLDTKTRSWSREVTGIEATLVPVVIADRLFASDLGTVHVIERRELAALPSRGEGCVIGSDYTWVTRDSAGKRMLATLRGGDVEQSLYVPIAIDPEEIVLGCAAFEGSVIVQTESLEERRTNLYYVARTGVVENVLHLPGLLHRRWPATDPRTSSLGYALPRFVPYLLAGTNAGGGQQIAVVDHRRRQVSWTRTRTEMYDVFRREDRWYVVGASRVATIDGNTSLVQGAVSYSGATLVVAPSHVSGGLLWLAGEPDERGEEIALAALDARTLQPRIIRGDIRIAGRMRDPFGELALQRRDATQ